MKYLIIGSGWYGCHLADFLLEKKQEIIIIDKSNGIFTGSSIKNQNRLHLGFHYPRSKITIDECINGYTQFIKKYKSFTTQISNNIYYISKIDSKLTIQEYITRINNSKLQYTVCDIKKLNYPFILNNVEEKCVNTSELYINQNKAKDFFETKLHKYLKKDIPSNIYNSLDSIKNYLNIQSDDIIINCTYNQLNPIEDCIYEIFVSLIYKIDIELFAVTVMDGLFFSIYPYDIEKKLYTITSVEHGIIHKGDFINDYKIKENTILEIKLKIEKILDLYIEKWRLYSEYSDYFVSYKAKPTNNGSDNDDRSVRIKRENNVINIYGGKITGIFSAEKFISKTLFKENSV